MVLSYYLAVQLYCSPPVGVAFLCRCNTPRSNLNQCWQEGAVVSQELEDVVLLQMQRHINVFCRWRYWILDIGSSAPFLGEPLFVVKHCHG